MTVVFLSVFVTKRSTRLCLIVPKKPHLFVLYASWSRTKPPKGQATVRDGTYKSAHLKSFRNEKWIVISVTKWLVNSIFGNLQQ